MNNDKNVKVKIEKDDRSQNVNVNVNVNQDGKKKPGLFGQLSAGCILMIAGGCGLGCCVIIFTMIASGTAIAAAIKYFL